MSKRIFVASLLVCFVVFGSVELLGAASLAEAIATVRSLKPEEKPAALIQGARAEGELVFYGTLPVNEFTPLGKLFNSRYRFVTLQHYFSPREGILNRALTESRAGRNAFDLVQVDVSYGYQLLNEGLVQPYVFSFENKFLPGTYDSNGSWHTMYYLTTALMYNTNLVKPNQVPQTYDDLLSPVWKGKMVFDPEAGYLLAAMEQAPERPESRQQQADGHVRATSQHLSHRQEQRR